MMDSNQMAAKGLRGKKHYPNYYFIRQENILITCVVSVLAMATGGSLEDLVYIGMVGITDPERPQVEQAVSQLKSGGVIVKMITGDAEKTAKAIGK